MNCLGVLYTNNDISQVFPTYIMNQSFNFYIEQSPCLLQFYLFVSSPHYLLLLVVYFYLVSYTEVYIIDIRYR